MAAPLLSWTAPFRARLTDLTVQHRCARKKSRGGHQANSDEYHEYSSNRRIIRTKLVRLFVREVYDVTRFPHSETPSADLSRFDAPQHKCFEYNGRSVLA